MLPKPNPENCTAFLTDCPISKTQPTAVEITQSQESGLALLGISDDPMTKQQAGADVRPSKGRRRLVELSADDGAHTRREINNKPGLRFLNLSEHSRRTWANQPFCDLPGMTDSSQSVRDNRILDWDYVARVCAPKVTLAVEFKSSTAQHCRTAPHLPR